MDYNTLHKYFIGTTSEKEEKRILDWVEESDENLNNFLTYRQFYDATIFSDEVRTPYKSKQAKLLRIAKWSAGVAASFLCLICAFMLYQVYLYEKAAHSQTVMVPAGQRVQLILSDGTKVWLNSQSTLTYPVNFGRNNRTVELEGEAFFDVTKSKVPFNVNTASNIVKVLGTQFNVSAYKDDIFETTLVEGVVSIIDRSEDKEIATLNKGDFFSSFNNHVVQKKINTYDMLKWRDGLYCFDDQPFRYILKKLGKYYGVTVILENDTEQSYYCTAKFSEKDDIEHILGVIQKDYPFTYSMNEQKDTIYIR